MIENSIVYRNLKKYNYFAMSRAEGSLLWDKNGKEYIDFTSGWNVTNLGWNHPEVNEAMAAQSRKNVQGLLWGSDPIQEEYAEKLTAALPKELDACVKATGGTEAIEEAMKIARAATGRKKIIGFINTYHGQLFGSLALGSSAERVEKIGPVVPEIIHMDFPQESAGEKSFQKFLNSLEEILSKRDIAGLFTEPGIITGWGSMLIAYPGFLKAVRELTKKYGTLLIVDEVGTGFSRTGKLFAIEHENVVPDMIVFAKAISNGGAAIGTVVGRSEIFEPTLAHTNLISTFGWTPIACAAAVKTLEIHQREKLWEQAEKKGARILQKLNKYIGNSIVEIRRKGLEIGIQFKNSDACRKIVDAAFDQGLHVIVGSDEVMQLMPPLNIPEKLLDTGLEILCSQIEKASH